MPNDTEGRLALDEEQALYFRARRCHLAGPGAPDPVAAARAILGAQAQILGPGLLALAQRTAGRPAADALEARLMQDGRDLVRTWGQRDTLHIYDAAEDWRAVVAARGQWAPAGRGTVMPADAAVAAALEVALEADGPITRRELMHLVPEEFVAWMATRVAPGGDAVREGAGRLFWALARQGEVVCGAKRGVDQTYATRAHWFPRVKWLKTRPTEAGAAAEMAARYLRAYGPATAADMAHFFGARVTTARRWLETIGQQQGLLEVRCGAREGLVALSRDREALDRAAPAGFKEWPVRLLPGWDCLLMGHHDKTWTVPREAERPRVWRKAAVVAPAVLARGRVVATWSQNKQRRRLTVTVQPLSGWRKSNHLAGVRREARGVARHLGLELVEVRLE